MDGETVQWMKKIAAERKIILTGSLIIEEDGHYYNRLDLDVTKRPTWYIR